MTDDSREYDAFICHASEDKEDVVRPLARELTDRGLAVWYDEFELSIGDSLRESIDRGLRDSSYGIVVLSEHFFDKEWANSELSGLVSRQHHEADKVILPLWYGVDEEAVLDHSPTLADLVAERVRPDNVADVAADVYEEIRGGGPGSGAGAEPGRAPGAGQPGGVGDAHGSAPPFGDGPDVPGSDDAFGGTSGSDDAFPAAPGGDDPFESGPESLPGFGGEGLGGDRSFDSIPEAIRTIEEELEEAEDEIRRSHLSDGGPEASATLGEDLDTDDLGGK